MDPYGQERWGAQSYWRESLDVGYGYFIVGPIDAVTGVATAVAHPIRTAQGIASLAGGLAADPLGAAGNLARLFYTQFEDSDTAGQATFGASTAIVPGAASAAKTAASGLQAGRRILSTSRGARTVTTAEAAVAGRAAIRSRVLANIEASKDARRASQFDVHLAVEDIYTNANKAVAAAKEAGLTNQHGALGMRAHQEFVMLNKATSERLAGRGIHIEVEPYALPSGEFVGRSTAGSLSTDALLQYRGANVRGFDLKTGRPWSRVGHLEREIRFKVPILQLKH